MTGNRLKGAFHEPSFERMHAGEGNVGSRGHRPGEPFEGEAFMLKRSGNHRVRHLGRGSRGDSHFGHHGLQTQIAGTVDGYCRRHQQLVANERGQATVEYVAVLAAFSCVAWGLGALWRLFEQGVVLDRALLAASHHVCATAMGLVDAFVF